jgi:hypothetical protein
MLSLKNTRDILRERRRFWIVPIAVMVVVVGGLFIISVGGRLVSAVYLVF